MSEDIFNNPRARATAEQFVKDHVIGASPAQLKQMQAEIFDALYNAPNGSISAEDREAKMMINTALSHTLGGLRGFDAQNVGNNSDAQMEEGFSNQLDNARYELDQATQSKSPARIEQARRELHALNNVERSQNGEEFIPYFETGTNDEERFNRNAGNAIHVKTSEEHLASMMGDVNSGREDI